MTKIEVLMKKTILCLLPLLGSLLPSSLFGETNIGAGHEYDNIRLSGPVRHAEKSLPASLRLLPNQTIRTYNAEMFGLAYDFAEQDKTGMAAAVDGAPFPRILPDFQNVMRGVPLPFNRIWFRKDNWKYSVGPLNQRVKHKRAPWYPEMIQITGPLELIRSILAVDPKAKFDIMVSVGDEECVRQAREIAEFLTGDASTEWGAKRIRWGLPSPVPVALWELGNETDWSAGKLTLRQYIDSCRSIIKAIRSVVPDAKIAPHAATAPWHETQSAHWKQWHRGLLKELAEEIDCFAFHPYYHGYPISYIENYLNVIRDDIASSSNPGIRIFISEHGLWPGGEPGRWENSWYKTHALQGCLAVSEWFNRMLSRPEISCMTMHACSSGPWGMVYPDPYNGKVYATALAELFKLYGMVPFGGKVIAHELRGVGTALDGQLSLSASAVESHGKYYLFLTNRLPETKRAIKLDLAGKRIRKIHTLTADSIQEVNTAVDKPILIRSREKNADDRITLPPGSITLLIAE